jgi:hypothetical protein
MAPLSVRLGMMAPGQWMTTARGLTFDCELEPRWRRWRVSVRSSSGAYDIACVSTIGEAEDAIVSWLAARERAGIR